MSFEAVQLVFAKVWACLQRPPASHGFFAALFTVLAIFEFRSVDPRQALVAQSRPGTDVTYILIHTADGTYFSCPAMLIVVLLLSGSMSQAEINDYFANGQRPARQPAVLGAGPVYMLLTDFLLYWIHRIFHRSSMWPFHAIHHSSDAKSTGRRASASTPST